MNIIYQYIIKAETTRNHKRNHKCFDIKQDIASQILGYKQKKPKEPKIR